MKHWITVAACLVCAGAYAQGGMGGYERMEIVEAGIIKGGFDGTIEEMTDGVHIVLLAGDPSKKDLPIKANSITFDWPSDSAQPQRIVLSGNVRVSHPDADIAAGQAVWDFNAGTVVFTGSPVMNSDTIQNMTCERVTLYMETGEYVVENPKFITTIGKPESSDLLAERDISNWTGFVDGLKAAWSAEAASPGKHILSLFPANNRSLLLDTPTNVVVDNNGQLIDGLNSLMKTAGFYNADAWSGIALPEEAMALQAEGAPEGDALIRFNRLAFDAAFASYQGG